MSNNIGEMLDKLNEALEEAKRDIESAPSISERDRGEIIGLLDAQIRLKELREKYRL
jgi:hypothetical protein